MCQITLLRTESKSTKNITTFATQLMYRNSYTNKDGTGILSIKDKIVYDKNKKAVYDQPGALITFIKSNKSNFIVGHTRLASSNKNNITDESSHPFEEENVILFHNGTLDYSKGSIPLNITDSQYFTQCLDKNYTGNMFEDVKNTYKDFTGKFAFIIIDKNTKEVYVFRGETAPLSAGIISIDNEKIFVINTQMESIVEILDLYNIFRKSNDLNLITFEQIPLEKEKAYKVVGLGLEELGDIKEKTKAITGIFYGAGFNDQYNYSNYKQTAYTDRHSKFYNMGRMFVEKLGLSLLEVCAVYDKEFLNNPLSIVNLENLENLYEELEKDFSKEKSKTWKRIKEKNKNSLILDLYVKYGLTVPYFSNSKEDLEKALNE